MAEKKELDLDEVVLISLSRKQAAVCAVAVSYFNAPPHLVATADEAVRTLQLAAPVGVLVHAFTEKPGG